MSLSKGLYLRCLRGLHPDIPLKRNHPVKVGRGPETGVKDKRLSRRQLELEVEGEESSLRVKVSNTGSNASLVAGKKVLPGQSQVAKVGDVIELLEGKYAHVIQSNMDKDDDNDDKTEAEAKKAKIDANTAKGHWSKGLLAAMEDPDLILDGDQECVIIADKYPKAKYHYLVLPKKQIPNTASLKPEDLKLLRKMSRLATNFASEKHLGVDFKQGYHAVPSMAHLHMHLISNDFVSDCLKTKKHWNSFNTEYFIPAESLEETLEEQGKVKPPSSGDAKAMLGRELKCHKCDYRPKNMPDLKAHLMKHL